MKGSKELEMAIRAAREAGDLLMKYYGRVTVGYKKDGSIVTDADIKSEKVIKSILNREFPDYSFLGEESGMEDRSSEYTWLIDPLDGTTNYCIKNPFFNVSIALAYKEEPILGVVYYPFQDELFYAEKGRGAHLNDEKIEVSKQENMEDSVICFCHALDKETVETMSKIFRRIKLVNNTLRQIGAAALELSYVACGRVEAFLMIKLNPWDVAAGAVIVREARGKVTDFDGNSFNLKARDMLASNGRIHEDLLRLIKP
ncbi:MAG: inositol monophosphatase [Candidatus Altiarchaeales archaeon]|nr:MAG: inositol monophosphatase [Candidatus Altiarchaeales archaeon]